MTYNVIVRFDGKKIDFGNCKVDIVSSLGNMAVVNVTATEMKRIAALPNVRSVSLGDGARPLEETDSAKSMAAADSIAVVAEPKNDRGLRGFFRRIFRRCGIIK